MVSKSNIDKSYRQMLTREASRKITTLIVGEVPTWAVSGLFVIPMFINVDYINKPETAHIDTLLKAQKEQSRKHVQGQLLRKMSKIAKPKGHP